MAISRFKFEREILQKGARRIAGTDEAGRGPLAGPVVAAAVIFPCEWMAEGALPVVRGSLLSIELRNIGWIDGTVAWKQDDRFGIAFVDEIDPKIARAPVGTAAPDLASPRFTRPPIDTHSANLRKI